MQSLIVTSNDKKKREEFAFEFCQKEGISKFDIAVISFEKNEESSKSTIGIKEVREIQKTISLKPLQGDKKALIINDAHLLTVEAQNALLKLLEEPPVHATIILTLPQKDILLPTICSRCTITELDDNTGSVVDTTSQQEMINSLLNLSVNQKLKLAQDVAKNKDETAQWIEKSIFALREQLLTEIMEKDTVNKKTIELLKSFQWGHLVISTTNTNPRLLLENLFLSL